MWHCFCRARCPWQCRHACLPAELQRRSGPQLTARTCTYPTPPVRRQPGIARLQAGRARMLLCSRAVVVGLPPGCPLRYRLAANALPGLLRERVRGRRKGSVPALAELSTPTQAITNGVYETRPRGSRGCARRETGGRCRAAGGKGISCSLGKRTGNDNTEKCNASLRKPLVEKIDPLRGKSRVSTPRGLEAEAGRTPRALAKETDRRQVPVPPREGRRGRGAAEEGKQTHGFGSVSFGRVVTTADQAPQKASS